MSLSGSISLSGFFVSHSASPGVAEFRAFQYTLLTRGQDIRRQPGIVIQDTLDNSPNTCTCTIDGGAPTPQIGEKIEIRDTFDDNRRLFAGTVQAIEQTYEGQIDQIVWHIQCIDFTWLLNRRRPFGQWVNTSVSKIVQELVQRYAPGFTSSNVQTNLAKATLTLDGSEDLVTVFNNLASVIGGGHWYVDYDQDVHFFHVVPPGLIVPIGPSIATLAHMTVAQGGPITQSFDPGYYLFRHTFLYSDGSESQLQAISNILKCTGNNQLVFTGIPLGVNLGTTTCVGRRIYYNKFIGGYPGGESIENIHFFCQLNDNTTTSLTTNFGLVGIVPGNVPTAPAPTVALGPLWPQTPVSSSHSSYQFSPFAFQVTFVNSSGVEGLPSPAVILSDNDAFHGWTVGLPIGGADIISRRLYLTVARTVRFIIIPDNTTTVVQNSSDGLSTPYSAFNNVSYLLTDFAGAVTGTVSAIGAVAPIAPFAKTFTTPPTSFSPAKVGNGQSYVQLSDQAADLNLTGSVSNGFYYNDPGIVGADRFAVKGWIGYRASGVAYGEGQWPRPRLAGDVYYASFDVATLLENTVGNKQLNPPKLPFSGHLPGPPVGPTGQADIITATGFWNGISIQFKTAFLYRDGSVSMPSPASPTIIRAMIKGIGVAGYQLQGIVPGPAIDNNDVVARFLYFCTGGLQSSNVNVPGDVPDGFVWPVPFLEPNWAGGSVGGIGIIPDNVTTTLANVSLITLDSVNPLIPGYTGIICGAGNVPYNNSNILSTDPIPIWPNPDGPFLESADPPEDIDDDNDDLLHEDSGSQAFTVNTDLSQIRNRVLVIGSGSIVSNTANLGDTNVFVADISAFSPSGGTVKYNDSATGAIVKLRYTGVNGVPGTAAISLSAAITTVIPQGTNIANFFEAEDVESQKFLAKIELDKNGLVTDGIHEYTIVDTSLKATFQLFMRAYAELEMFSKPIVMVRYATRDPKTRSGQIVHIDLTNPPCTGDFLIQSVTIDQIHDESDQLAPRYTASASSSKFDLNDLLLKIIGESSGSGSGNSSAGIAPAGAAQADTGSFIPIYPAALRRPIVHAFVSHGATTPVVLGQQNWSNGGSGQSALAEDGTEYVRQTGSNIMLWGMGGNLAFRPTWLPRAIFRFRTGPSVLDTRYWVGTKSGSTSFVAFDVLQSSGVPDKGIGVRYSTTARDGGFCPYHARGDGTVLNTTQTIYSPVVPVSLNTDYVVEIKVLSFTTWQVIINGIPSPVLLMHTDIFQTPMQCFLSLDQPSGGTTLRWDWNAFYLESN